MTEYLLKQGNDETHKQDMFLRADPNPEFMDRLTL